MGGFFGLGYLVLANKIFVPFKSPPNFGADLLEKTLDQM